MGPTLSIIIVYYDALDKLLKTLECLTQVTYDHAKIELIIVNNSSSSIEIPESIKCRLNAIKVLSPGFNSGYAGGNNFGYSQSSGETVLFLNPDIFVEPDSIQKLVSALAKYPYWGAAMGKLMQYDWETQKNLSLVDSVGLSIHRNFRGFDIGQGESENGKYSSETVIGAVSGAAFFSKRSALENVQRRDGYVFDPKFFAYKEDVDLSIRLRRSGYDLIYVPIVFGYHCRSWKGRKDRREVGAFSRYHSFKNRYLLMAKHMSLATFLLNLPILAVQELGLFVYVVAFERDIISAYGAVIKDMIPILKHRIRRFSKGSSI